MNNNKKNNKKLIIIISIIIAAILLLLLVFMNKKENITLSCERVESSEQSKLTTEISINKIGKKIHWNYVGKIIFFIDDEFAYNFMSLYVENQVSKLQEIDESIATLSKSQNEITYEFDFDMDMLNEEEMKDLLGIYSNDLDEIKKHFESGGLICEEI